MATKGDDDDGSDNDNDKNNILAKKEHQISNDNYIENGVQGDGVNGDGNVINIVCIPHYQCSTENQLRRGTSVLNSIGESHVERSRNDNDEQENDVPLDDDTIKLNAISRSSLTWLVKQILQNPKMMWFIMLLPLLLLLLLIIIY